MVYNKGKINLTSLLNNIRSQVKAVSMSLIVISRHPKGSFPSHQWPLNSIAWLDVFVGVVEAYISYY